MTNEEKENYYQKLKNDLVDIHKRMLEISLADYICGVNYRQIGTTTRLADYYIQALYNNPNKEIVIHDAVTDNKAHIHLTQMILQRLYTEHQRDKFKIINQNTLKYELLRK